MSDRNLGDPDPGRGPLPQWWWDFSLRARRLFALSLAVVVLVVSMLAVQQIRSGEPHPDVFVARMDPARVEIWNSLAECESGSDWSANTENGYYGGLQFSLTSWGEVNGETRPDAASPNEQIMRAEMLWELQGFGAWPACSAKLGLD